MTPRLFTQFAAAAVLTNTIAAALGQEVRPAPRADRPVPVAVRFENDGAVLRGRVFMPGGETEVPAVVILGGGERGPQTEMKRRLAEHFAEAGVGALIYDSPGTGGSTGNALLQTRDARADEAVAAVRFLAGRERIDADRVGVMGISEGALITMLAAAHDDSIAFAIPVSGGFGVSSREITRYRIETMCLARGVEPAELQKALLLKEILFAMLGDPDGFEWRLMRSKAAQWPDEPWDELIELAATMRARTHDELAPNLDSLRRDLAVFRERPWFGPVVVNPDRFDRFIGMPPEQFQMILERGPLAAGDYEYEKTLQNLEACSTVACPVLAVWGEYDEYLPPHRGAAFLDRCLGRGDNDDVTFVIMPEASHILTKPGPGQRFADGYPEVLSGWVVERFGTPADR